MSVPSLSECQLWHPLPSVVPTTAPSTVCTRAPWGSGLIWSSSVLSEVCWTPTCVGPASPVSLIAPVWGVSTTLSDMTPKDTPKDIRPCGECVLWTCLFSSVILPILPPTMMEPRTLSVMVQYGYGLAYPGGTGAHIIKAKRSPLRPFLRPFLMV